LRASAPIFLVFSGSRSAGTRKPCLRAFCAERAFPAAVRGPVLDCALRQLV
jgi:hypothetical protein